VFAASFRRFAGPEQCTAAQLIVIRQEIDTAGVVAVDQFSGGIASGTKSEAKDEQQLLWT
jgi:hypothetical protein